MRGFRIKPNLKKIDLIAIKQNQVEYFCATQTIDKIRAQKIGLEFNQELADFMEEKVKYYFIVKTNMEYDVISGLLLDPVIKKLDIVTGPVTEKARKCIDHYINSLK
ncbi:hypothetical protein [Pedobacter metabolipauper]|uniref:Uncharacterized protein n=1 Tax=Pedobacter metabolipauper TaxID=425513 RepID=A0A4R6SZT1_9SPHI|nr:hypothetical protein [Pedobacter metabolipauper]TDQ12174.1 hypothetical protein ATK78_1307 [Pedobacter metabolipauper]